MTHLCLGNHEGDVGLKELKRRCSEFRGVLLNSNVPGLLAAKMQMRAWDVVSTPAGRKVTYRIDSVEHKSTRSIKLVTHVSS